MRHNSGFEPEPPPAHITEGRQNYLTGTIRNHSRIMATEQVSTYRFNDTCITLYIFNIYVRTSLKIITTFHF